MSAMDQGNVLDDSQAQTGAAQLATATLVNHVESLEDARDMLLWDAATGVLDVDGNVLVLLTDFDIYLAALVAVFDGVIHEVDDRLLQQRRVDPGLNVFGAG
jgi:hypothetical protein